MSTRPPPTVTWWAGSRTTKRSCHWAAQGRSSSIWARASSPGPKISRSRSLTRAIRSAVPMYSLSSDPGHRSLKPRHSLEVHVDDPAGDDLVRPHQGVPRSMSLSIPARLSATRPPTGPFSIGRLWDCIPRTRTRSPEGITSSSSSMLTVPPCSVPVTTVPEPLMVKTRSTQSRGRPSPPARAHWRSPHRWPL